jgi:hypothetical protein
MSEEEDEMRLRVLRSDSSFGNKIEGEGIKLRDGVRNWENTDATELADLTSSDAKSARSGRSGSFQSFLMSSQI